MPDCYGIDMHRKLPRCYLNTVQMGENDKRSCAEHVMNGELVVHEEYDLFYKQTPDKKAKKDKKASTRRLEESVTGRHLLGAVDAGSSWSQMLRFKDVHFSSAGNYKACFCDHDTLEDGAVCSSAADYKVEIGEIHVSGVKCLVEEKKFQRGTCETQFFGGLRCYDDDAPMWRVPPATIEEALLQEYVVAEVEQLVSYCQYSRHYEVSELCHAFDL